ncbi:hypothetical protein EWF20_00735 [Sulfolobus sp. S-194]|uniref:hypothetical protein n=1 Tax=Sulfolobus sp. S-194 TaxID=2512240 RepID=UPI00143738FF|nr:hypothetical protein [Sulfolobus sp. S-194]QIW22831.1 hypothetical protein EWF20_00735 [Sulfolobus sp. S-194]
MRFVLLKLEVNGYVTTRVRRIGNYYFSTTDYIPATQLRGAILAEYYYQKGKIDQSFFTSPAFPIDSAPSHYFSPAEGRKSSEFTEEKEILRKKNEELEKNKSLKEVLKLSRDKKPRIGMIIKRVESKGVEEINKYTKFSTESFISMHVAIEKTLASSYHRMLFAYEYKKFDELWALAKPSEVIDIIKTGKIRLGRGRNRTNTLATVEVIREIDLPEPQGLSYCLSQCIPSLFGKELFTVGEVEGRKVIIGSTSTYVGWFTNDSISGQKPSFKTLSEGTLVLVKNKENYEQLLPAGLNFMFGIDDLDSLLRKVMVK